MSSTTPPAEAAEPPDTYFRLTRTATYGFLSALPLILFYEVLILMANRGRGGEIRVSSEIWLKQLFDVINAPGHVIMGGVLLLVGVVILVFEYKQRIPLRASYFAGIIMESTVYAVVVALVVSRIVWAIFAAMALDGPAPPQLDTEPILLRIALSIGAGIYEELLFRVLLVGGMYVALNALLKDRSHAKDRPPRNYKPFAYAFAAVVGALIFSGVHYIGALGDVFTASSFTFRFLFGLALNVLYLTRGFGVAAWTHALYDVMVVTHLLG